MLEQNSLLQIRSDPIVEQDPLKNTSTIKHLVAFLLMISNIKIISLKTELSSTFEMTKFFHYKGSQSECEQSYSTNIAVEFHNYHKRLFL